MNAERTAGEAADAPARILYIDDDAGLCRLVQRALEARGYAVEVCADGAQGLARVARGGIDAVALDHHMPLRR
jgi:CheY-like chemotaxis protein